MPSCRLGCLCTAALIWASAAHAAPVVSDLQACARDGQVFLTWKEAQTDPGTTFNVYVAPRPIGDLSAATLVGHHIERHSARDWWEDPASFTKGKTPAEPLGYLLEPGKPRLDPQGGLFVHTVRSETAGKLYFAVTASDAQGREDRQLAPGANTLKRGVDCRLGPIRPIWQGKGQPPALGAGKGLPLWLNLHAKGGVVGGMEYLFFGDQDMGWREGLPVKFSVRVENQTVVVRPTDRVWINRPHDEAGDGGMPAIWTFWYGYNSKIYDRAEMGTGVPTNYTERRNLWILDWVREHYQPDTNRWYCSGGSMGGCGTVSFGQGHPELFAALHGHVPIVSYTYLGSNSARRLEPSCWTGPIPPELKTNEGVPLLDRMNGLKRVSESRRDLPPLFMVHGRQDASIPWENNPPFYRALAAAKQAFAVYWDDGTHSTCGKKAPADVRAWLTQSRRYRLNESFPVFTGTSSDCNPGDGRPEDGDTIGWINRGMDWGEIQDAAQQYSITLSAEYPGIRYPVTTDVTLRRLQQFKPQPGQRLTVRMGEQAAKEIAVGADGLITIPGVSIPSQSGVRLVIER